MYPNSLISLQINRLMRKDTSLKFTLKYYFQIVNYTYVVLRTIDTHSFDIVGRRWTQGRSTGWARHNALLFDSEGRTPLGGTHKLH